MKPEKQEDWKEKNDDRKYIEMGGKIFQRRGNWKHDGEPECEKWVGREMIKPREKRIRKSIDNVKENERCINIKITKKNK